MTRRVLLGFALLLALCLLLPFARAQQPVASVYNASPPAPASGTVVADQADPAGNKLIALGVTAKSMTAITTSNGTLNATFNVFSNSGAPDVLVQLDQTTTITAGAVKFQVSYDGTNFVDISADAITDPTSTSYATIAQPYTLQASTNKAFLLAMKGARALQILMSTALTGTGSVTPYYSLLSYQSQPLYVEVADGTNGPAAVKAASTAAVAADKSLVVAISPNSPNVNIQTNASVVPNPQSVSGAAVSACNILSAASTNATSCKGSAGNFYGFEIYNTTTTVYYLRLYNTASAPTCSSSTGFIRSIPIPPAGSAGQVGGIVSNLVFPTNYGTGIGYCITGGSSSTDNTNAATGIFGEVRYE